MSLFKKWNRMRRRYVDTSIGRFTIGETWDEAHAKGLHKETERMRLVRVNNDCWQDSRLFQDGRLITFEIAREAKGGPYRIVRIDIERE